jgi:hypothetical protein
MPDTVFVACKFRSSDSRSYTYEWTGEPLAPGDFVKVADRSGDGWKRVEVVSITDVAPSFACKPILAKLTAEELDASLSNPTAGDANSAPVPSF